MTAGSILHFHGAFFHLQLHSKLLLKSVCPPHELCVYSNYLFFPLLNLQATKFRQTPGSGYRRWEQVNTCTDSRSRINGKSHPGAIYFSYE